MKEIKFHPLILILTLTWVAGCAPSHFDPVVWNPPPDVGLSGAFENTLDLAPIQHLPLPEGIAPETIVVGPEGRLYTGLKGGHIVRFRPDGSGMEFYADTGGRANGLAFDRDGNLIVADSYNGLLSIDPTGKVEVLAAGAEGQPFLFNDGLDIAADGTIWFTDATARFPDGQFHYDILESRSTGRLLTYDPVSRQTRVRVADLRFPNGIALGPGDEYVLINEMLAYRTLRHWITGPKAGRTEVFVESYPGFPDDIRFNEDGLFWVALAGERVAVFDWLQPHPRLKSFIGNAIGPLFPDTSSQLFGVPAFVVAVDLEGNVVHSLRDESESYLSATSVLEHKGRLFIGSISMPAVGVAALPQ